MPANCAPCHSSEGYREGGRRQRYRQGPVPITQRQREAWQLCGIHSLAQRRNGDGSLCSECRGVPDLPSLPAASAVSPHARPLLPIGHTSGSLASESPKTQGRPSRQTHSCPSGASSRHIPEPRPLPSLQGSHNHTQLQVLIPPFLTFYFCCTCCLPLSR